MNDPATAIGSLGVGLLLAAFVLNGTGRLDARGAPYLALNAVGAGLACWASALLEFLPFVVLEGVWCAAALAGMARRRRD